MLRLEYLGNTLRYSEFDEIGDILRYSTQSESYLAHIHIGIATIGGIVGVYIAKVDLHIILEIRYPFLFLVEEGIEIVEHHDLVRMDIGRTREELSLDAEYDALSFFDVDI